MEKKTILGVIITLIVILAAGVATIYFVNRPSNDDTANNQESNDKIISNNQTVTDNGENNMTNGKTLVVYYSAQNHTKNVAEKIAQDLNADVFEIIPVDVYTNEDLNWTVDSSRVNREHEDENLRNIALKNTTVPNWSEYDTVLIGYPIWWGIAAWPVNGFIEANNFDGKTVIPFCTSTSSGIGESDKLLSQLANTGNWISGHRFSENPSDSDIENWTNSLKN